MQTLRYDKINETLFTERLENGLTINIVPRPEFSKCFAMLAADYGAADRRFRLGEKWTDTPAGVAHFLEHKLFDMPDGNALGMFSESGADPNAFTGTGMTAYHFESTDKFYDNLKTLLEFVSTPYFTAESVQKEQGIIGQEIRMTEDEPGYMAYISLLQCLFANNPVRDSIVGTIDSIAQITDKTLYDCHRAFYNPANMTLAVVGDVDPARVIDMAREILPKEPGEIPERDYGAPEAELPHRARVEAAMEVSAPQFVFGCAVSPAEKGRARLKQYAVAEIALRLIFGRSSPLYTGLYAEGLLNGGFEYEFEYTAGAAMAMCFGESRDVNAVMERLHAHIGGIIANGPDADAFENAKRAQFGAAVRVLGSFSELARTLAAGVFEGFSPPDIFDIMGEISARDVADFIAANLTRERLALSVVNPTSHQREE